MNNDHKMAGVAFKFQRSGEQHHACRLSDVQVVTIRRAVADGASRWEVAAQYGIHKAHLDKLVSRRLRKDAEKRAA